MLYIYMSDEFPKKSMAFEPGTRWNPSLAALAAGRRIRGLPEMKTEGLSGG